MPRIAIIGAGSMVFSRNLIADILAHESLKETTFSLMDVDEERLELAGAMARSIIATRKADARVKATRDRRKALDGADYVVNTIGVGGFDATKKDLLIPQRHGVRQTIGDTLGIGGIFRSLRSIPVVLDMCRDIEQVCPDAQLLTYTNPMATHCLAIERATKVRHVGLCHGVRYTRGRMIMLARLVEMGADRAAEILAPWDPHEGTRNRFSEFFHECVLDAQVQTVCAGINHMAAFLVFRRDGQDLYPLLRAAYEDERIRRIEHVRLELMMRFGYFLTETCGHISEYLPWFLKNEREIQRVGLRPNCYILSCEDLERTFQEYKRKARGGEPFIQPDEPVSIEYASRIINAIQTDQPYVFNGNQHNRGGALISNLPADSCVEVPTVASGLGLLATSMGEMPAQLAAMMTSNISVQDLIVRAVLEENRRHVYHAAYMDPNTAATLTLPQIDSLVDEMIAAHGDLMPRFLR
jgi:alpha-galactosidase